MIARFVGAALLSGGVTFGLFFLMQYLILGEEWKPSEKKGGQISIVRDVRESDTQTKRRLPQQVKQEAPPPPPKMQIQQSSKPQTGLDMGGMISAANMQMGGGPTLGEGAADTDITPLVRVPPQYPPRAAARGIEGWVLMEFTISPAGQPTNVVVVDADPKNIFNRAAIRAVKKWKYRPQIIDGKPTPRPGVQTVLTFELEK